MQHILPDIHLQLADEMKKWLGDWMLSRDDWKLSCDGIRQLAERCLKVMKSNVKYVDRTTCCTFFFAFVR